MGKNSMILILSFSVLTFITSLICTLVIINNENARTEMNSNKVIAKKNTYISSYITYKESNTFTINNLRPGDTIYKNFVITNNSSKETKYNIYWENIYSNWGNANMYGIIHPEEFTYTINCSNGEKTEPKQVPINNEGDNIILENITLPTDKTNTCTMALTFNQKEEDQSYNLEKTFTGTYIIKLQQ
jgi:hypothetical protein